MKKTSEFEAMDKKVKWQRSILALLFLTCMALQPSYKNQLVLIEIHHHNFPALMCKHISVG